MTELRIRAVGLAAEVTAGDDLAALLASGLRRDGLVPEPGDVLVVAQKIVSKAEGRFVELGAILPSPRAQELAFATGKDPRLVELVLAETAEVLRARPGVLIVRHRLGFVMANAGIDVSNVPSSPGVDRVLLLPEDPDRSATRLRDRLAAEFDVALGVIVSDSFGRPWRRGVVNIALGCAGFPALVDRRGERDREGRPLQATDVALADAVAAAAGLVMGEGAESRPAALVGGFSWAHPDGSGRDLLRPIEEDLFR